MGWSRVLMLKAVRLYLEAFQSIFTLFEMREDGEQRRRLISISATHGMPSLSVMQCMDKMERDRLVLFMNKLILHRRNVKDIMDANGVRILVDLLTLAHLHTSRYDGLCPAGVAVHAWDMLPC
jgi:hypothetical protein